MKMFKNILASLTLALAVFVPAANVSAVDNAVSTLSATTSASAIEVSGTTIDGILAVSIEVYNEDGTTLIAGPESINVASNAFSYSISGTFDVNTVYTVKAADYDGGTFKSIQTTVSGTDDETDDDSDSSESSSAGTADTGTAPKASDSTDKAVSNISLGASIVVASAVVYGTYLVIKRKNTK